VALGRSLAVKESTMNTQTTSERLGEAFARALRSGRRSVPAAGPLEPIPPPPPAPCTIAVSRESGANGHLVARAVGARLGWPVYDQELIQKIAAEMGLRAGLLEGVDEKRTSWLLDCLQAISSGPTAPAGAYVHRLVETLASLAAKGECVILGRGAAQVLPAESTLRVRLVGPVEDRIAVMRERLGVGRDEAERRVAQTDRERGRFVWDHFHRDPSNPSNYDLILNTTRLGVEACADLIVKTLQRWRPESAPRQTPGGST
jgi:cytidylate kinase